MVKLNYLKIGDKLLFDDPNLFGYDPCEIILIGYDPYKFKWVAACKDWLDGISHLDDEEIENYCIRIE